MVSDSLYYILLSMVRKAKNVNGLKLQIARNAINGGWSISKTTEKVIYPSLWGIKATSKTKELSRREADKAIKWWLITKTKDINSVFGTGTKTTRYTINRPIYWSDRIKVKKK